MDFISKLDKINFLEVYSLMQDIDSEKNISPNSINIPLLPSMIRYRELFPIDSINMRDDYVRRRYKIAKFLQGNKVIKSIKILKGMHTWDGELKIEIEEDKFNKTINFMHEEFSKRKGSKNNGKKDNFLVEELDRLNLLFEKFHEISLKLKERYKNRDTLIINDEYDVQDLLKSLLILFFSDIRSEEWTPSYAGSSSRIDFLLKDERLVIEVKKTSSNRRDRIIGEEILIDIDKYSKHPDCRTLVCFIYDPEGQIKNRKGFIKDIESKKIKNIKIYVVIKPDFR
jgi:hypothetical protein